MELSDRCTLFLLIMIIVASEATAQYFIRKYSTLPAIHYYIIGALFYCLIAWVLHYCYNYTGMGIANGIWNGLSTITVLTIGYVFFGDEIDIYEMTGMLLCITGVAIIQYRGVR